jgi:hypothetical protein
MFFLCVLPRCESMPIVRALESGYPGQQPTWPNATFGTGRSHTSFGRMFYGIWLAELWDLALIL